MKHARLNVKKHVFTSRVVNTWNGLSEWIVNANNVESCERKLDKSWKNYKQKALILYTTKIYDHVISNVVVSKLKPQV